MSSRAFHTHLSKLLGRGLDVKSGLHCLCGMVCLGYVSSWAQCVSVNGSVVG
jgi:hypothetical protein